MLLLLFKLKLYKWLELTPCHICVSAKDYSFKQEREGDNCSSSAMWSTCLPFGLPCLPSIPLRRLVIVVLAAIVIPSMIFDCCVGGHCHSNYDISLLCWRNCHLDHFQSIILQIIRSDGRNAGILIFASAPAVGRRGFTWAHLRPCLTLFIASFALLTLAQHDDGEGAFER